MMLPTMLNVQKKPVRMFTFVRKEEDCLKV